MDGYRLNTKSISCVEIKKWDHMGRVLINYFCSRCFIELTSYTPDLQQDDPHREPVKIIVKDTVWSLFTGRVSNFRSRLIFAAQLFDWNIIIFFDIVPHLPQLSFTVLLLFLHPSSGVLVLVRGHMWEHRYVHSHSVRGIHSHSSLSESISLLFAKEQGSSPSASTHNSVWHEGA